MTSAAFYPRYKSYGDKQFVYSDNKKAYNYEEKYYGNQSLISQPKGSYRQYNSKSGRYYEASYYQGDFKQEFYPTYSLTNAKSKQYSHKRSSNSPNSTMGSEGDQESEITGFKIVQSGKILIDSQNSDSDAIFSPVETKEKKEDFRFASATKFLGPNPTAISMPSFV